MKKHELPIGASSEEEEAPTGFVIKTEGNRVIMAFERDVSYFRMTGRDAVEVGRTLIEAGQAVRRRPKWARGSSAEA